MTSVVVLFTQSKIARRVDELASEIAAVISGDFTIVGVLKGSFVFLADLIRSLDRRGLTPRVEFLTLSSYGKAKQSSGDIHLIGSPPGDISGRAVLLIDDIIDTGHSIAYAKQLLLEGGAAKIWTCALLDKPSRREVDLSVDFVGFTIDDFFVVGYGIDYAEDYRHLPYIGKVD